MNQVIVPLSVFCHELIHEACTNGKSNDDRAFCECECHGEAIMDEYEQTEEVSDSIRIHNALWRCYEMRQNDDIKIGNKFYIVRFYYTNNSRCARVDIDGSIWESQNMKKASPNTELIEHDPNTRISWNFYHSGDSIVWLEKVQSHDVDGVRHVERFDLRKHPNELIENANILTAATV